MRTVFQIFLLVTFVLFSPLVFLLLAVRMAAPSASTLKSELVKKDVYQSAISEFHKHIDTASQEATSDDPVRLLGPFVKKEISARYIQDKMETLIDDTQGWVMGKRGEPVLSFKDLKDKLVRQNRNIVMELEKAVKEMEQVQKEMPVGEGGVGTPEQMPFSSKDLDKFLKSDFEMPMGVYLGWLKTTSAVLYILGVVLLVCYSLSGLLIVLLAPGLQAKLRWIGGTLLLTGLWNIPGAVLSTGSAVVIAKTFTQGITGAQYVLPFIETFLASIITSYARVTTGALVMMFIFSIGTLIVSFLVKPQAVPSSASKPPSKTKK
jgi:hypothetical protein